MLAKLLDEDHSQQTGAGPGARYGVERCRRLADLLTIMAAELLAHILQDAELARNDVEALSDVLSKLA